MSYRVDGIYSKEGGYWKSNELFVKHGEVRVIDGKLHALGWSALWCRAWYPIEDDLSDVLRIIENRCVLKKKK